MAFEDQRTSTSPMDDCPQVYTNATGVDIRDKVDNKPAGMATFSG
jgi:hypothetical protein